VIAGPLADRWGAKGFAVGGNGIMALSLVGMSFAPDYGMLGITVFCLGFGAGGTKLGFSGVHSSRVYW